MAEPCHRCAGISPKRGIPAIVPGVLLVLMPKCPACLAGYVALLSGVSLPFAAASALRLGLICVGVASVAFFLWRGFTAKVRTERRNAKE